MRRAKKDAKQTKGQSALRRGLLLVLALLLAVLLVLYLPAFHLQELVIEGDLERITKKDIAAALSFSDNQHLLKGLGGSLKQIVQLRYGAAQERVLNSIPAVHDVTVELDWPGRILCTVSERQAIAWLAVPDGCAVIDKEGVALEILDREPDNIPIVEGMNARSLLLGQPLSVDMPDLLLSAIDTLAAIIEADLDQRPKTQLLRQVRSIRPIGGRRLYLTLKMSGADRELTVLTETGMNQAGDMLWLRFALDEEAFEGLGKGLIDLTGGRKTFRPDG